MIETTAIVCPHVFRSDRPAAMVVHHSDGAWQLVCGGHDHPDDCSSFETVGLEHLIDRQVDLQGLLDLKPGWLAERTPSGWVFSAHDD